MDEVDLGDLEGKEDAPIKWREYWIRCQQVLKTIMIITICIIYSKVTCKCYKRQKIKTKW